MQHEKTLKKNMFDVGFIICSLKLGGLQGN